MSRRPRGRPKLKDADRRSEPVSVRLTPALRKQLEEARRTRDFDHTLSQEVEARLRRSFDLDGEITKRFGSPGAYAFLRIVAAGIEIIEKDCFHEVKKGGRSTEGKDFRWLENRFVFDQVTLMINDLLERLRPPGKSVKPTPWSDKDQGKFVVYELIADMSIATEKPEILRALGEDDPTINMFVAASLPLLRRLKLPKWEKSLRHSAAGQ
jgi:hypothetical protein